jgi:hypothetical protein
MRFLTRLFGDPVGRQMKEFYGEAKRETERKTKPLGEISKFIVSSAQDGVKAVLSDAPFENAKKQQEAEIFALYEFLYFYMHFVRRIAHAEMPAFKLAQLEKYIGTLISAVAIDAFFAHWGDDRKIKMRNEFFQNLNNAEKEYSNCKSLMGQAPMDEEALITGLSCNLSKVSGHPCDTLFFIRVSEIVLSAFDQTNLKALIISAGTVLDEKEIF